MSYNPVYLIMVTAGANNNKYYRMYPSESSFTVEYGRVGNGGFQTATYPISQWSKKYNEKIRKGYQDKTNLMADLIIQDKPKTRKYIDIENTSIAEIVGRLQRMAKQAISENYTISSNKVTQAMVDEAQLILNELCIVNDIVAFNKRLIELFFVIPRKMSNVADYLPKEKSDFGKIIQAEQDLLDVMKGQVVQNIVFENNNDEVVENNFTILDEMGLSFSEVDNLDIIKIKSALGQCSGQYRNAWKIENQKTQSRFSSFVKEEGEICTKLLWHGSRNENWWSIINAGLVLKPTNAVITGKMFGHGTYFATKARKSVGYTSLSGSYWARGSSNTAFMGLYDVAYGKPFNVYSFDPKFYNLNYNELQRYLSGSHCLHAHEGSMLKNDEIIVYREDQTTIKYLVEITS